MTLPVPNLDDLRFQRDLVDEARKRIIHYCPEWTEYNLSDPGITLIELFAWMTELMVYRLNRVPEKNYLKFLEMLGLQRKPANSARTELTFWLSVPLPITPGSDQEVHIPQGMEVRSEVSEGEVIFTTNHQLKIVPPLLTQVRTEQEFNKNYFPRLGLEVFHPFSKIPRMGDTFYLGFDEKNDLSGHILQMEFSCDPTEAVGIRREDPPWVWEVMTKSGTWAPLSLSTMEGEKDTTGGLNNEQGKLVLYLPLNTAPGTLYGLTAQWIRCRIEQRDPLQGMYSESPRVKNLSVFSIGATTSAMHSVNVDGELLGTSSGEPAQLFTLRHSPVLSLQENETLEVEEYLNGEVVFVPWKQVDNFANSSRYDRHFVLDAASGVVHCGPSVKQQDGTVHQYGRIPESGRRIRFSRYRYGGGVEGNLPAGTLNTMNLSLAYVSRVTNLVRAVGGRDQETIDELKMRSQRELQTQHRAVTAQDFEQFTLGCSRSVARARCLTPNELPGDASGTVTVLVVPAVADALIVGNLSSLRLDDALQTEIRTYLDKYRLMTTSLHVREPVYTGVKVNAKIVPQEFVQTEEVSRLVNEEINRYLTPIPLDSITPSLIAGQKWEGWPFGRDLFAAEIISLIQQIPQVKYVLDVEILYRRVMPVEENPAFDTVQNPELSKLDKVLIIPDDGLICSLEHEIEIVNIQDLYQKG